MPNLHLKAVLQPDAAALCAYTACSRSLPASPSPLRAAPSLGNSAVSTGCTVSHSTLVSASVYSRYRRNGKASSPRRVRSWLYIARTPPQTSFLPAHSRLIKDFLSSSSYSSFFAPYSVRLALVSFYKKKFPRYTKRKRVIGAKSIEAEKHENRDSHIARYLRVLSFCEE